MPFVTSVKRYKPPIRILENVEHALAFRLHFNEHIARYGDVVAINLVRFEDRARSLTLVSQIDNKGSEKVLADKFQQLISQEHHRVAYQHFDFHAECPGLKWERLDHLLVCM